MNVTDAVQQRVSVRAFRPDLVSGAIVREILDIAKKSPSGGNLQPWRVFALAGEPLADFRALIAGKLAAGETETPEYDVYPHSLWEPFRKRRRDTGAERYAALGVTDKDPAALKDLAARNYRFFDAPVGIFCFVERYMGPPQWSDLGMYLQSVMLLLREEGLDSCPQECWALYAKTIAEFVAAPPELMLFCGMAIGHAHPENGVNSFPVDRAPLDEFATLAGFEG